MAEKRVNIGQMHNILDYYFSMEKPSYREALIQGGGYAESTANALCGKYFRRAEVKEEMERRRQWMLEEKGVTTDALIERLKAIAFGDLAKFIKPTEDGSLCYDFREATEKDLTLIRELSVDSYTEGRGPEKQVVKKFKFNTQDQLRAVELLGRMLGSFVEKVEHSGELSVIERLQRGRALTKELPTQPLEGTA